MAHCHLSFTVVGVSVRNEVPDQRADLRHKLFADHGGVFGYLRGDCTHSQQCCESC